MLNIMYFGHQENPVMWKNIVIAILALLAFVVIGVQAYDRSALKQECALLKERELQLKNEADAEKQIWSSLYTECVNERNGLILKLKEASSTESGNSSN